MSRPGVLTPGGTSNQFESKFRADRRIRNRLFLRSSARRLSFGDPNIAVRFADLLAPLSQLRRGVIARLSQGYYYEGWRPSRAEVAELVARELGKP